MKNSVFWGLVVVLLGWSLWNSVDNYLDLPSVLVDGATGECVGVIQTVGSGFSCSNLPTKYHRVVVAPKHLREEL